MRNYVKKGRKRLPMRILIIGNDGCVKFPNVSTAAASLGISRTIVMRAIKDGRGFDANGSEYFADEIFRRAARPVCAVCGKEFAPSKNQKTCSPECAAVNRKRYEVAYYKAKKARICAAKGAI